MKWVRRMVDGGFKLSRKSVGGWELKVGEWV